MVFLIPGSEEGRRWIVENLGVGPRLWRGGVAAVETRCADAIIGGMQDDGLEVVGTTRVIAEEYGITPDEEADLVRWRIVAPSGRRQ